VALLIDSFFFLLNVERQNICRNTVMSLCLHLLLGLFKAVPRIMPS